MVMATPFLHALKMNLDGELWGIGKSTAIHLYNGLNYFDRFISFESEGIVGFLDLAVELRRLKFKRGILLPHSFRAAMLFFASGIEERIGYSRNKRGFMLTRHVEGDVRPEPTVEHYLKILDTVGAPRILSSPILFVTDDEELKFDRKQADMQAPYVVFIAGAQYGESKRWPDYHFAELADMIIEKYGVKVYLVPAKGEERLAYRIKEKARKKDRVEVRDLGVRDLKVCLSRASAVVSNDTGPRHISVALSVPTIVLLGPMDDSYTRYPSEHTFTMSADVPCRPCNKKSCDSDHACMRGIAPAEVFAKLEGVLETGLDNVRKV
jgi:heptosyltransferase-2